MKAYANQCAAEDAEADELLKEYFEKPRKAARANIRIKRKFHTGGVVRRLNAKAHAVVASEPLEALIFADLAEAVADLLPDDLYPNRAVYELRGTASKERANALLRLAKFDEALEALRRAERAFGHLNSSGYGLAAVELVRAAVYYERGELEEGGEARGGGGARLRARGVGVAADEGGASARSDQVRGTSAIRGIGDIPTRHRLRRGSG
jgi:hypothetical protein